MGYKVLLIDLDPQGNATSGVGLMKKNLKNTIFEVLTTDLPTEEAIIQTHFDNLSIIPTHTTLARAEYELGDMEDGEYVMKKKLAKAKETYDYIIIDCPPSLSLLTVNALNAASGVVIPMQCEYYALEGLTQLMLTIRKVKKLYNPSLCILGILITMYNGRLNLSVQVLDEIKKYYADKLFTTPIPRSVKLSEAPSYGIPGILYDPANKGSRAYDDVTRELMERIGLSF